MNQNQHWYYYLCEYYGVSPEAALSLGTRASGRKPSLPGSPACEPVSEMTFEDIWASDSRKTTEEVFKFYKELGAWAAFRQCVRHKDLEAYHCQILGELINRQTLLPDSHMCEYGAGVAPFTTTFLKYLNPDLDPALTLTIADVDCEHLNFARYRLNRIKKEKGFHNLILNFEVIKPDDKLPTFLDQKLNVILCFEVLEHVPSPVKVIENFKNSILPGEIYIENFIKHEGEDEDFDGPDLLSARNEREEYYKIVNEYFSLLHPSKAESDSQPNCTRFWKRNLL